jgi:hypothetical protein
MHKLNGVKYQNLMLTSIKKMVLQVSYRLCLRIAKAGQPHTTGEQFFPPPQ